jgi:hypothetical protein
MAFKILNSTIIDDTRNIVSAGIATISTIFAGSATTTGTIGQALQVGSSGSPNGAYISGNTGIGSTNPGSKLSVIGDAFVSGVVTTAQLIANVAQGTAPITVGSSTLVSNLNVQYLNSQPGSYYQIANNLTGTAPGNVISQSSGLTVTGNVNISGTLSVGGTSVILNAATLQIQDRDIVVGYTTDVNNNDVSNDNTANHGGISVASTVGSPIINIPLQAGINSNPSTYKQWMWVKQGNYSGLGTDVWLSNYAVSIGNTATVQNLSRLTVGAGFTVFDTYLDAQDIRARNINTSGVTTSGGVNVTTGNDYKINGTSVLTSTTLGSGVVNSSLTSVGTLGILQVTGVTTSGGVNVTTGNDYKINGTSVLTSTTLGSGVVNSSLTSVGTLGSLTVTGSSTLPNVYSTGINTAATYYVGTTKVLDTVTSQVSITGIQTIDATTKATLERELAFAPNDLTDLNVSGISTLRSTTLIGGGTSTGTAGQVLQVTGISSGVYIGGSLGIGITNPTQPLDVNGNVRFRSGLYDNNGNVGSASSVLVANGAGGFAWQAVTSTGAIAGVNVSQDDTGVRYPLLASGTNATTTAQYIDNNGLVYNTLTNCLGIGSLTPTSKLDIIGDVKVSGIITTANLKISTSIYDNNNATGSANQVLTAGPSGAGVTWATLNPSSVGAIAGFNVSQDDTGVRYPLLASGTNTTTTAQYIDNNGLVYNTLTNCLGIGSLTPTSKLDIIGDVKVSGIITANDFNSQSDRKLKTNIQIIENPIEKVFQINGVSFNWKKTGKATMGVIAQEVEKVLPELVSDTDPKTVNYNGLIGLLIECIKDQQKQIDELKKIGNYIT